MNDNGRFHCNLCDYETRHFNRLALHYRYGHALDPGFRLKCNINGCPKTYSNVKSWLYHIVKEFNINHEGELSLQYFDSSWDDWVDVDNLEQLPDKAKLQATIVLSLNGEGEKSEQINSATLSW